MSKNVDATWNPIVGDRTRITAKKINKRRAARKIANQSKTVNRRLTNGK